MTSLILELCVQQKEFILEILIFRSYCCKDFQYIGSVCVCVDPVCVCGGGVGWMGIMCTCQISYSLYDNYISFTAPAGGAAVCCVLKFVTVICMLYVMYEYIVCTHAQYAMCVCILLHIMHLLMPFLLRVHHHAVT